MENNKRLEELLEQLIADRQQPLTTKAKKAADDAAFFASRLYSASKAAYKAAKEDWQYTKENPPVTGYVSYEQDLKQAGQQVLGFVGGLFSKKAKA